MKVEENAEVAFVSGYELGRMSDTLQTADGHRSVTVKAKSSKAKNRLANTMGGNPVCIIEQDTGEELFLVSENRKYCFWVSLRGGICRFGDKADAHWEVIDERRTPDELAHTNPRGTPDVL